jgi:hypothetical protein
MLPFSEYRISPPLASATEGQQRGCIILPYMECKTCDEEDAAAVLE